MKFDPELFDQIRYGAIGRNPGGALLMLTQIVEELVRESDVPEVAPEAEAPECYQFMGGGSLPK
jgi:hypothetical protein